MTDGGTKRCSKCGVDKPLSEYHRDRQKADGHTPVCKACRRVCNRAYYQKNRPRRVEHKRQYYRHNRQASLATTRDYYRSHRAAEAERRRRWRLRHPDAHAAGARVRRAIRQGQLHPEPCEACGATKRIDAHHEDYSKPLDVQWLCRSCHKRLHAEQRETES